MIIYSYIDTEELCKLPLGGIYRHSQKAQQLMDSLLQSFSYSSFFERDIVESLCSILLSIKKKKGLYCMFFFIYSLLSSTSLESFLGSPFILILFPVIYRRNFLAYCWTICLHDHLVMRCIKTLFYLHWLNLLPVRLWQTLHASQGWGIHY